MRSARQLGTGEGLRRGGSGGSRARGGFALLVVLLVLIALLVLSAPFLLMARNADRASAELSDRARARLALDAAARHARLLLGESHSGLDRTPYFDDLDEIAVDNRFEEGFLDPSDPTGMMWDLDREDVAGKIDLNSAPPQVIANLMGASTRFVRAILPEDTELPVASMSGFDPTGVLWSDGELLHYTEFEGRWKDTVHRAPPGSRPFRQALSIGRQSPYPSRRSHRQRPVSRPWCRTRPACPLRR
jgi:type II secretory pathway pseudopilin PulG